MAEEAASNAVSSVTTVGAPLEAAEHPWASLAAYNVRTPAEVLAEPAELFVIDGVLHSSLTLLYGASEIGKSQLVVSLTRALIDGSDWMGHRVPGPCRVLILSSDPGGVREYAERLGPLDASAIGLLVPPLPAPTVWIELAERCHQATVGVVVVDNLYSWASTADVNANAETGAALSCLDPLLNRGIAVLLVHHTPKHGGKTPAGAHNILAKARHSIYLSPESMTVHGNHVAERVYPVERQDGRIVGIGEGALATSRARKEKKPHQRRADRVAQEQEALTFLRSMPSLPTSERGLGDLLLGRVDRVGTPGQGREVIKYMVGTGSLMKTPDAGIFLAERP